MPTVGYRVISDDTGTPYAFRPQFGDDVLFDPQTPPTPPPPPPPPTSNLTLVLDEQFINLDPTRWKVYDNSNFGAPQRVQLYRAGNVSVGGVGASAGSTGGTSMRLVSKRETVTYGGNTYNFTGGMADSKSVGAFYPRYGRYEFRCKTPHGQGLWPSIWLTSSVGASMWEFDVMEYFHGQLPGYNSSTLHGSGGTTASSGQFAANRFTNNGTAANGGWGRTFFEHPTYTPGWHTFTQDIYPVTSSAGTTVGDITKPSLYVKYTTLLDGKKVFEFVDPAAMYYTTNGGSADEFAQFYLQGCQIDGPYVGGVDDALGYSHQTGQCLIGGTPPGSCTITRNNVDRVQRASFTAPANVLEIDYIRVYKRTAP